MSSEESYRAILRYLTNEREPYAPGTEGNVKRKIRKAAACYVVRGGTLYYQRRQRHRKTFAELEVVLQPERRRGLIEAAHLGPGGTHHTRHQTWHDLSKTYWWRGERGAARRLRASAAPAGGGKSEPLPGSRGRGTRKEPHFPQEGAAGWGRALAGVGPGGFPGRGGAASASASCLSPGARRRRCPALGGGGGCVSESPALTAGSRRFGAPRT